MKSVNGPAVLITLAGSSVPGEVCFASDDGSSLLLRFEGKLGEYESVMAILWIDDGYRDLIGGSYVGVRAIRDLTPRSCVDF
jgi:hypothetical protein